MNISTKEIEFGNTKLTLTNQRVIYWEDQQALILSDIHIGKTAHFRQNGIPISDEVLHRDLERLEQLIHHFSIRKLIVVGDLFHADYNSNIELFSNWLNKYENIDKLLILGNHDKLNRSFYRDLKFSVSASLDLNGLCFVHDESDVKNDEFSVSGHTHPGVWLKLKARQKIKLPCFHLNKNQLVLPAFSLFSGLNTNCELVEGVSFAFTEDNIFKI
ncbi:ligase-associated DNA damage response endonuclease PdeM [Wenyingzhuangia sp. IMCC45533]